MDTSKCTQLPPYLLPVQYAYSKYYLVNTTSDLLTRLANVVAGDMVELKSNTVFYLGDPPPNPFLDPARGRVKSDNSTSDTTYKGVTSRGFVRMRYGTASNWITICGPKTAVIDGSDNTAYNATCMSIVSSKYIRIVGMTLQWAAKRTFISPIVYVYPNI